VTKSGFQEPPGTPKMGFPGPPGTLKMASLGYIRPPDRVKNPSFASFPQFWALGRQKHEKRWFFKELIISGQFRCF
jgi:hypothetical protein